MVISENRKVAEEFGKKIDSGMLYVNEINNADHRLPFGGVKNSGFGRDNTHFGVETFANIQTYWIN